jgi:methylated-DNA-[protein]-cysteine S-methyltransferase
MGAIVESNAVRATLTRYRVPGWGDGELWMLGSVVLAHDFSYLDSGRTDGAGDRGGPRPLEGAASPPTGTLVGKSSRVGHGFAPTSHQENGPDQGTAAEDLVARLADYLAGSDVHLCDVELDLSWATPFQQAVAHALRRIPRGEVVTYGELAALAGYPGAARAVGSFCAHNRFALLVPCHRVVGAGGLGGYGATGLAVKRRLLALEGVVP